MRKRFALIMLAAVLATGCGSNFADGRPETDGDTVETGKVAKEESQIYTDEDIYLKSFDCGYISEYQKIRYTTVIIETKEQLDYAEDHYGLKVLESASDDYTVFESPFAATIQEMKEQYPLEEYNYVFRYDEVSSGGYYYHADRLEMTEDSIRFLMDDKSYSPRGNDAVAAVMGGFGHIAAVPKEYMEGRTFSGVIYPDANDMYQDQDYQLSASYDLADASLYQVYGDGKYLIRNQAEYEAYLAMADGVKLNERRTLEMYVDFERTALLVTFFTREEPYIFCETKPVEIDGNEIKMDYELVQVNPGEKMEPATGILYAYIPQRFLTEESYRGWITPQVDEATEDIGESYIKEVTEDDVVFDEETGLAYVRNQVLISVELNVDKAVIEKLAADLDAEIVGYLELVNDYQLEFKEDKTLEELEEIIDSLMELPEVSYASLNYVVESFPQ